MNRGTVNHMTIYALMNAFYVTYKDILDENAMIAGLFDILETNRLILSEKGGEQGGDNTGIAEDKEDKRVALRKELLINSGPASVCCYKAGNHTLYKLLKLRKSTLDKLSAALFLQAANEFVKNCTENMLALATSGVTVASLAKVSTAIVAFDKEKVEPVRHIKIITAVTSDIATIEKQSQVILNVELIDAMGIYEESNNKMYKEFMAMTRAPKVGVRKPTGPRATKALVKVKILHDLTMDPVVEAEVRFVGVRGVFKTDVNGELTAKLSIGAQMGKIVAVDFIAQNFVFTLTEEGYEIVIRLVPTGV